MVDLGTVHGYFLEFCILIAVLLVFVNPVLEVLLILKALQQLLCILIRRQKHNRSLLLAHVATFILVGNLVSQNVLLLLRLLEFVALYIQGVPQIIVVHGLRLHTLRHLSLSKILLTTPSSVPIQPLLHYPN